MRYWLADLRNRWLVQPGFRAFFGRIWPFRLIARRRARQLFDISAGFVYSKTLMACLQLDWFNALRDGPQKLTRLADAAGLDEGVAERLLLAACSLDLLEARQRSMFALGPLGAALIGDQSIAAMAQHHEMFYADMADPVGLLKGEVQTGLSVYWPYAKSDDPKSLAPSQVADYSHLMAASQPMIAEQVLSAYDFSKVRHVADLGGGTGAFLSAVHSRYPGIQKTLFDLPAVVANTELSGIDVIGGSFLDDELPSGVDLYTLVRIVHDHDDDTVLALLSNIRRCIPSGSRLMIAEPLADTPGAKTVGHAYFGFYLSAMGSGRARSQAEIDLLLQQSGFAQSRFHATPVPLVCSVLTTDPV